MRNGTFGPDDTSTVLTLHDVEVSAIAAQSLLVLLHKLPEENIERVRSTDTPRELVRRR